MSRVRDVQPRGLMLVMPHHGGTTRGAVTHVRTSRQIPARGPDPRGVRRAGDRHRRVVQRVARVAGQALARRSSRPADTAASTCSTGPRTPSSPARRRSSCPCRCCRCSPSCRSRSSRSSTGPPPSPADRSQRPWREPGWRHERHRRRPARGTGWTGPSELQADTAAGAEMVAVATGTPPGSPPARWSTTATAPSPPSTSTSWSHPASCRPPRPGSSAAGGLSSVHDSSLASSRLARGDPATTIGVNMHFAVLLNVLRSRADPPGHRSTGACRRDRRAHPVRHPGRRRLRQRGQRAVAAGPHEALDHRDPVAAAG